LIDDDTRALIEGPSSILVGTRSAELVPNAIRGWGGKVSSDGQAIELFVDRPTAATGVSNIHDNGRVSACFTDITTNRSVQIKGRCVEVGDPQAGDWDLIDSHRLGFQGICAMLGFPAPTIRNLWSTQVVKIRFIAEQVFNQTPGPDAGKSL
jgi:hypothetical protein